MARIRNRFRESAILAAVGTFAVSGAFFGTSALINPANPLPFGVVAEAAPLELTPAQIERFIEEQAAEAGYENFSDRARATWDIVADVLYRRLGAYELQFELTDDPIKNCAQTVHGSQGGCYHTGGEYQNMIFISPGIDERNAEFIAYHEYSHHLQHLEGGTRFVEDIECDADLRAAELFGGWNLHGFKKQCLDFGLSEDQIFYVDDFAILEAKLAEKRG